MQDQFTSAQWPYLPTLAKLLLALALGVFVGLERERRGKDAGVRTFAFASLIGCLGALVGPAYGMLALGLLGILVFFLNWQKLRANGSSELTTSAALLTLGFVGILCGLGHTFTPVAVAVCTASLLAWKEPLTEFSLGLTEKEIRAALLLAIIAFVVYPALPAQPLDAMSLIEPRSAWATVILIAALGFLNYILWKLLGSRGLEISGFLGGLVNSTVAAAELANRTKENGEDLVPTAYRGIVAANAAMLLRNGVLAGLLAVTILPLIALPLALMFAAALGAYLHGKKKSESLDGQLAITLESPFSLLGALKFGLIFLAVDVAGNLAQRYLGAAGFYAVSLAGGLISSASATASAATLAAHGKLPPHVAANGVILASVASLIIDVPLVARVSQVKSLGKSIAWALLLLSVAGLVGVVVQTLLR